MAPRAWGEESRTTLVCIDSYEDSVPYGRFYNPFCKTEKRFGGILSFLKSMEETVDQMDFPKAYTVRRKFADVLPDSTAPPEDFQGAGQFATFAIRILFRQNTSWQGSIVWLEGKQEESFRSVLELLLLIGSALDSKKQN